MRLVAAHVTLEGVMVMTRQQIMAFIQGHEQGVLATTAADGPEADLIMIAVSRDLEILFNTSPNSSRFKNISNNHNVALVVGWSNGTSMQLQGQVRQPSPAELPRCIETYSARFPEARELKAGVEAVYFMMRPHWVRYSNTNNAEPRVMEMHLN